MTVMPDSTDFAGDPLTAANLSRISPRHDLDRENHHENHEAPAGFGRRARVVELFALLNRSPA